MIHKLLFTIKHIQTLAEIFKIKRGMSSAIVSDIFLHGAEIIKTFATKWLFLNLYTNGKTYLSYMYNVEQHIYIIETRIFSKNF